MKSTTLKMYPCSMNELYSICNTAIGNFLVFTPEFITFRKAYDEPYTADSLAMLANAINLPDGNQSYEHAEILHGKIEISGAACLRKFRLLKRYIIHAYPNETDQKAKLTSAGAEDYKSARDGNWDNMLGLNNKMVKFAIDNTDELKAAENMPDTFIPALTLAASTIEREYAAYKQAKQTAEITATKVKANNELYKVVMSMLLDGQTIFEQQPEVAERFVFSRIWDMITVSITGVKLKVKNVPDNMPATNAVVSIQKPGEPAEVLDVNEDGELQRKIAAGPVTLVVTAPGKKSETIVLNLDSGSYKSVDVELQNAA